MSINQRFKDLLKILNFNPTAFSKEIKVSQTAIRRIVEGDNQPSPKVLTLILERYPNLNMNWLLTGKGDMFLNDTTELEALKREKEALLKTLADKEEIIRLLKNSK